MAPVAAAAVGMDKNLTVAVVAAVAAVGMDTDLVVVVVVAVAEGMDKD